MTKFPPRSLKKGHQDALTRLRQNLLKDCQSANDNGLSDPKNPNHFAPHLRPFVSANDNGLDASAEYHILNQLSSEKISTEGRITLQIGLTGSSLLLYGKLVHNYNIALVRRGLTTFGRGQEACGNNECPHCAPHIGIPKPVPDLAVLAFLLVVDSKSVSTWAAELTEKLSRYAAWPTTDFSVTDWGRRIRLVVRRRTLIAVTRLARTHCNRDNPIG